MEEGRWKTARAAPRLWLPLFLSIAGLFVAAACGGDDNGDATPSPEPTAEERSATPRPTGDGPTPSPTVPPAFTTARFALQEWAVIPEKTRARAGTVTFQVRNEGTLTHQFLVIRTNIEKDELPRKPNNAGADELDLDVVGRIDSIEPGANDEVEVDVEEGQYVIICNLAPGGESHYLNGMFTEFEITPTAPLDSPTPNPTQ